MNTEKQRIAELLLKNKDPYQVALSLYPGQYGKALQLADQWALDPEIEQLKNEIIENKGVPMPLSDAELAYEVLELARNTPFHDDKIKAYALAAEIMGHKKAISKTDLNIKPQAPFIVQLSETDANL